MSIVSRCLAGTILASSLVASCGRHDVEVSSMGVAATAKFASRDSTRTLGPGDVRIASTDSAVEVAIVGDTIVAGLGKKVLDEVRSKTDTAVVAGDGFAASIEKAVKSSVATALSHEMLLPVIDVSDVRSENGKLVFYARNGSKMHMFESSSRNRSGRQTFSDGDAQRFISAFRARKARTG